MSWEFIRASDLDHAVELLATSESAQPIAGGTALTLGIWRRETEPQRLIGIGHLPALVGIDLNEETLRIGAGTRLVRLSNGSLPTWAAAIADSAQSVASPAIRTIATIGGDLGHGVHTADLVPAAIAMDGQLELAHASGTRSLSPGDLVMVPHQAIPASSLIAAVNLPVPTGRSSSAFIKFGVGQGMEYPIASVALAFGVEGTTATSVRVALGAASLQPQRLERTENFLLGLGPMVNVRSLIDVVSAETVAWISDRLANDWYRMRLTATLIHRAWIRAWRRLDMGHNA